MKVVMKMFVCIFLLFVGLSHGVIAQCTSNGRFPNDLVEDCRGYTTCIGSAAIGLYQYDLACPPHFIFNHFDSQCKNASNYYCLPNYQCTEEGLYENPNSTDCSSFITCIHGLNSTIARLIDCPVGTIFHANERQCVNGSMYACPSTTTLSVVVTTEFVKVEPESVIGNGSSRFDLPLIYCYAAILLSTVSFMYLA